MGREITKSRFSPLDFRDFKSRLTKETTILKKWFRQGNFGKSRRSLGLELETWLVDNKFNPAPENGRFLAKLNHPMVVPELSRFNTEINTSPQPLSGKCFTKIHQEFKKTWRHVQKCAGSLKLKMLMIGTLPTLTSRTLGIKYMSDMDRYRALNEQIMFSRRKRDLKIHIQGKDQLKLIQKSVMIEAACTSLQIHIQVEPKQIKRHYNAAIIASAPVVAVAANSPYLFGKELWNETRIPLFEQAISLPGFHTKTGRIVRRVTFGSGYVRQSMIECYAENLKRYPVLLPMIYDDSDEWLSHLRLHNGTIWRWNRPIIGLNRKGKLSLRIEHRVASAGPTIVDMVANIAFSVGLIRYLAQRRRPPARSLSFDKARQNFYTAAQFGLEAKVYWIDKKEISLRDLILNTLLSQAEKGLESLGVSHPDRQFYLNDIMARRVASGQTGSVWQRAYVAEHGRDFRKLTRAYFENQERDKPVSQWKL